jgi:P-type Cu+ transporter
MLASNIMRAVLGGTSAVTALLGLYTVVLAVLSGWDFTISQFKEFWPFIISLASGFGIQVGLFLRLRQLTAIHHHTNHIVAASGTTSTMAMLACCTHYLANVVPVLGAVGLVSIVAQYQVHLLWIGLIFNAAGLAYIAWQFSAAKRAFKEMHAC